MLFDNYWLEEIGKYKVIKVGLSCGLDSTVLLHFLACQEHLKSKLQVIHVNHQLSPNADSWQKHCEVFCKKLKVSLISAKVQINGSSHIEESAREARYQVFKNSLQTDECLVLAHHQNDQVETLLFNLFRGTGIDGLASIPKRRKLGLGELIRPLLNVSRDTLYSYAMQQNLKWIEDESNFNIGFSRNFIRHSILPVITDKWPSALQNISDCASKCEEARDNLNMLAKIDCPDIFSKPLQLKLDFIESLPKERIINVLRFWLKFNEVLSPASHILHRIISEVIFAKHDKIPKIIIGNMFLSRYRDCLYLINKRQNNCVDVAWDNFPKPLYLTDGRKLTVIANEKEDVVDKNQDIWVRFRVGGECIKHNGKSKKLKKLLQDLAIPPWERDYLPLLFVNGKLQAIIGLLNADFDKDNSFLHYQIIIE